MVEQLLRRMHELGVSVWVDSGKLRYRCSKGTLSAELISELRQNRDSLISVLGGKEPVRIPLLTGQQSLLFLQQLLPSSAAYNVALGLLIDGSINATDILTALHTLISRHGLLGSRVIADDGRYVLSLHDAARPLVTTSDASSWSMDTLTARLQAIVDRPFDLLVEHPVRLALFERARNSYCILLCLHHIVTDGLSMALLADDFLRALSKESLPPPPPSFADAVLWESCYLGSLDASHDTQYWLAELQGELPLLALPTDHPRPTIRSGRGASVRFRIDHALTQTMKDLAQGEGSTLAALLLACWFALLHRYCGQQDLICGLPSLGREDSRFLSTVGYFVNMLPIRMQVDPAMSFRDLLRGVARKLRDALGHSAFPFARLLEHLGIARDLQRTPVYQTSLAFENLPAQELLPLLFDPDGRPPMSYKGISVRAISLEQQVGQTDLGCMCSEITGSVVGRIDYCTELFDKPTIDRLCEHFLQLIRGACDQPDTAIGRLPLLSEKERQQMLSEWNQTEQPFPTDKCIHELFEEQAKRTPTAIAVECEGESLSYQELDHRASAVCVRLQGRGVQVGDRVALCVERSSDMVVLLLAILKAGAAYVPVDGGHPIDRIQLMLEDAAPSLILTNNRAIAAAFADRSVPILQCDESVWSAAERDAPPRAFVHSRNVAYVMYTSGSTGRPKGVLIEHRSVVNFLAAMRAMTQLTQGDTWIAATALTFDIAGLEIWLPLAVGATVLVAAANIQSDPERVLNLFRARPSAFFQATPAAWGALLEAGSGMLSQLRAFIGGEASSPALLDRLAAETRRAIHLYGPTETTIWSTAKPIALGERPVSIGRPVANTHIYILDKQMQPVPIGVPGELHIGGEGVARGYLNRAELTEEKFIRNPFGKGKWDRLYKTGDLARYREDGNIEYLGRVDQQVKLRGYRIELGEIEAVLAQQEAVASSVVMLREDVPGDKRLVAYVVLRQGMQLDEKSLRASLGARLPEYMIPSVFVPLPQLPLTTNGKVNRSALAAPVVSRTPAVHSAPRSPLEAQLCEAFASVLRLDRVGRDEDFFELGGDSLKTVRLVSLASQRNIPLSVRDVFAYPTVARLSAAVTQLSQSSCLVSLQEGQGDEALILLPGSFGTLFAMGMLSRSLSLSLPIFGLTTPPHAGGMPMPSSLDEFCMRYVKEMEAGKLPRTVWLIGHSVGGVLAILLGDRLRQLGWQVAGVLLLDSWEPGRLGALPLPSLLSELCTMLGLPVPFANDPALSDSVMTKQTISAVQRAGLGGSSPESFVRALLDSATGLQSLLHRVHIGIPQVPIHLLRADGDIQPEPDTGRRGWTIPLRSVTPLRGNHFGILRMPYLAETAQAIVRIVKRKEGGETEA